MQMTNIHDQRRRDKLAAALRKAEEQAATCIVYLTANERPDEEVNNAYLALEHIRISLEHLGEEVAPMPGQEGIHANH
ncbi:hypothetical protein ACHHV8_33700 [Paenibacillus sp. TAB 01]|uniref:hypothetical protein n=1 Tax=Paenibacillus sp. TAB 01 TaxID=3368988 RepID=UPI00374FE64B